MPIAFTARQENCKMLYLPTEDAGQAGLVDDLDIIPVDSLGQLVEHLYDLNVIPPYKPTSISLNEIPHTDGVTDFADVKG
jgi:magnesium chelatase family protein